MLWMNYLRIKTNYSKATSKSPTTSKGYDSSAIKN